MLRQTSETAFEKFSHRKYFHHQAVNSCSFRFPLNLGPPALHFTGVCSLQSFYSMMLLLSAHSSHSCSSCRSPLCPLLVYTQCATPAPKSQLYLATCPLCAIQPGLDTRIRRGYSGTRTPCHTAHSRGTTQNLISTALQGVCRRAVGAMRSGLCR